MIQTEILPRYYDLYPEHLHGLRIDISEYTSEPIQDNSAIYISVVGPTIVPFDISKPINLQHDAVDLRHTEYYLRNLTPLGRAMNE